jgi:hypothetical protein
LVLSRRKTHREDRNALGKERFFSDSSQVTCIMANKQTGFCKRSYVPTLFLFLVILLLACSKGREEPLVSVSADCQQFLDKYFDAWKSKDVATLQALSFYLSPHDQSRLPEGSLELWRASKNKLVTKNFEQVAILKVTRYSGRRQPRYLHKIRLQQTQ